MTVQVIVGYQILGSDGYNIHGDEDDPFKLNSFDVLVGAAVETARAWCQANPGYRVAPVHYGDVEEPEYVGCLTSSKVSSPTP